MPPRTHHDVSVELGRQIRAELARRGRSQTWLAETLRINQSNVSKRILGKQPFDIEQLYATAEALDMDVRDLLPTVRAMAA